MKLPPAQLITTWRNWQACLARLREEPRLAIDLEANSMYAYQEQVCLIQISIPAQDFIIDPVAVLNLRGLGQLIEDPAVEKVFHAAEYDLILLKREYDWQLSNLFDTMWAARILGYKRYGLANLLEEMYRVKLNKRYQKSNWCKRPLSPSQLAYAQHDTHFLLRLRDHFQVELRAANCLEEAHEIFAEQTQVTPNDHQFDPDSFWSINGVQELTHQQQAILKALNIYRDEEAQARDLPLFKVLSNKTLLQLAQAAPKNFEQLQQIHGMTWGQIRRYGHQILNIIATGKNAPHPSRPKRSERPPERVLNRYERLRTWRKNQARKRGVESDVIISRHTLWDIAQQNPSTPTALAQVKSLGSWRCRTYGQEILTILRNS